MRDDVVIHLDRTIANDLAAMLHDTGRRATTGAPVAAVSAVEAEGFDSLLHELEHALGRPCVSGCQRDG
jgi:HD superfamily phosphodiesterase